MPENLINAQNTQEATPQINAVATDKCQVNLPTQPVTQAKKRKVRTVNPDKARAYIREYVSNGFNKTQAYRAVVPDVAYESARRHGNQNHNRVLKSVGVNTLDISHITTEYIISGVEKVYNDVTAKNADKLKALELLGDFRRIWADKSIVFNQNILTTEALNAMKDTLLRIKEATKPALVNNDTHTQIKS